MVKAINWNRVSDDFDLEIWKVLTTNFWVPEKITVSNDIQSYSTLTDEEKWVVTRVFGGLTLLDTMQGEKGAPSLLDDAATPHEKAVLTNIAFMEALAAGTELLTTNGWQAIETVTKDTILAQYNQELNKITWANPVEITDHFAEEVYEIAATNGDGRQVVSGGHRVYYEELVEGAWVPKVVEARELVAMDFQRPTIRFRVAADTVQTHIEGVVGLNKFDRPTCMAVVNQMRSSARGGTFYEPNKQMADYIVALSTMAGMVSRCKESRGIMCLDFVEDDCISGDRMRIKRVEGQQVYCVQVPSTFLVTRNGQTPIITGNCVHARSYSNIFSTLCSTQEIDDIFRWVEENPRIKRKQEIILSAYEGDDPVMRKAASVLLESFLFYSGFYIAFYWAGRAKLTNTADMIRLILRDEVVHGNYIGYKLREKFSKMEPEVVKEYHQRIYALLQELYVNEMAYTEELYDRMGKGVTEDVKQFVRYNANKALDNMGMSPAFTAAATEVSASIMTSLAPVSEETHDFFSGSGSSYVIGTVEETTDDDWDI